MKFKKNIRLALLCAILLAASAPAYAQSLEFLDAMKCYRDRKNAEAIRLFEKELTFNPDNDAAHFYLANALLAVDGEKNVDRAEACFKKAVELDPENYWYRHTLALFYEQSGRPELSAVQFESLIGLYPKKSSLYFDAASSYVKANDFDNAIAALDRIEQIRGKSDMIACSKMDLLVNKNGGDEKEAYRYLEEYYTECPTPRLATILGDKYQRDYRDSLAIVYYNQALEMDDNYAMAYYGRAHSYQGLRQYDLYFSDMSRFMKNEDVRPAIKAEYIGHLMESPQFVKAFMPETDSMVLQARSVDISDSTLNNAIGLYFYRTDRREYAAEIMKQNTNFHPESFSIGFQYLLILYYSEFWNPTIDVATVLIQRFPDHNEPLLVRASSFRRQNQPDSAIEDYQAYIKSAPKDSSAYISGYSSLGDLYHEKGDAKASYECYKKVLKMDPENTLALNNYAYFLSLDGKDLKKAREMSRKTIEKEPDNPTYLDTYAWILHLLGQDVEAKAIFKHAMLYGGKESPDILEHYAEVLKSLNENDLANIYMNQAKSLRNR